MWMTCKDVFIMGCIWQITANFGFNDWRNNVFFWLNTSHPKVSPSISGRRMQFGVWSCLQPQQQTAGTRLKVAGVCSAAARTDKSWVDGGSIETKRRQNSQSDTHKKQKNCRVEEGKSVRQAHLQPGLTIRLEHGRGVHGGSAGRNKMAAVCSGPALLGPGIKETERRPAAHAQGAFTVFFFRNDTRRRVPGGAGGERRAGGGNGRLREQWNGCRTAAIRGTGSGWGGGMGGRHTCCSSYCNKLRMGRRASHFRQRLALGMRGRDDVRGRVVGEGISGLGRGWDLGDGSRAEQETTKQAGHVADGHSAGDICCSLKAAGVWKSSRTHKKSNLNVVTFLLGQVKNT